MPARIELVYNPASGSFRQARLTALASALHAQGFAVRLWPSSREGLIIPDDAELVCVHGGDGTLRLVAAALGARLAQVPLCIAPAGTINLVARELGYAGDPVRFAAQLAAAWARGPQSWVAAPVLACDASPVMACLSIGPDSAAVAGVSEPLKARIGRLAYGVALARLLWRWPRGAIRLAGEAVDGTPFAATAEAAFIARGRFYAGPFRLSPDARLTADWIELVLLPRAGRAQFAAFMLATALGLPAGRLAQRHALRRLTVDAGAQSLQVDGDAMGAGPLALAFGGPVARFCV